MKKGETLVESPSKRHLSMTRSSDSFHGMHGLRPLAAYCKIIIVQVAQ